MHNKELIKEILTQIETAIETIKYRFKPIECVDDFLDTPSGQEKLDSICMLFIAIGESLKNVDKLTDKKLLINYNNIDWKAIKGMKDVLSHHYFDLNAEAIFNVCNNELNDIHDVIKKIVSDIK